MHPEIFELENNLDNFDKLERLIELWEECGILVIPQVKETDSDLIRALHKSSPKITSRWKAALRHMRVKVSKINFEKTFNNNEPPTKSVTKLSLISVDEIRASVWGIKDDKYSMTTNDQLEISKFGFEHRSECFKVAIDLCKAPIKQGTTFSQLWGERLSHLAQESKNITVCDRFLLDNFIKRDNNSAFEELIEKLARLNSDNKKILTIYTSGRAPQDDDDKNFKNECYAYVNYIKELFNSLQPNHSLLEIQIRICKYHSYFKKIHYRFFLFEDHNFMMIDKGLSGLNSFGKNGISQNLPVQCIPWNSGICSVYRNDLSMLRKDSNLETVKNQFI
jgi:hypothetical protein